MSDRLNAVIVVLEADIRDDDAAPLLAAIAQLRGVLEVRPHVANGEAVIARAQARGEILTRLQKAVDDFV